MPRTAASNEELIELVLASCVQKLGFLRGLTPRSFPADEYEVIKDFGLACCRCMFEELQRRNSGGQYSFDEDGRYLPNPLDEDTQPGWKSRRDV